MIYGTNKMFPEQLIGVVCLNHRYVYGTKIGIEHLKRPELIHHKHCNILFELNVHKITENVMLQKIMNSALHTERNKSIITDISSFENILMTLNDTGGSQLSKYDPYIVSGDKIPDCEISQVENKYDAVAPFRKIILDNILTERNFFIDFEKSLHLKGPILNLINILSPKFIAATGDNHSFINEITNDKYVSVLSHGITSKNFPLQIPLKRSFLVNETFNGPKKVYLVIAPYNESIIPVTSTQNNYTGNVFDYVSVTRMIYNVNKDKKSQVVQYPSYAISYMIVPYYWCEEAVLTETYNRCKHYTQSSNLALQSYREYSTICLGILNNGPTISNIRKMENTDMYIFDNFNCEIGEWNYFIAPYKRDIMSQKGETLSEYIISLKSSKIEMPVTSLSARLYRSQLPEFKQNTMKKCMRLMKLTYTDLIDGKDIDSHASDLELMLMPLYKEYLDGYPNNYYKQKLRELDVSTLITALKSSINLKKTSSEHKHDLEKYRPKHIDQDDEIKNWEKWSRKYPVHFENYVEIAKNLATLREHLEGLYFDHSSLVEEIEVLEDNCRKKTIKIDRLKLKEVMENDTGEERDTLHQEIKQKTLDRETISLQSHIEQIEKLRSVLNDKGNTIKEMKQEHSSLCKEQEDLIKKFELFQIEEMQIKKRKLSTTEKTSENAEDPQKRPKKLMQVSAQKKNNKYQK